MKKIVLFLLFFLSIPAYGNPKIDYKDGIYHIELSGKKAARKIDFVSVEGLETNKDVHNAYKSILTVNAGFFDPKNKKTISYINSRSADSENPLFNEALVQNPLLNKNLDKILNRTEFRVLECENKYYFEIVPHNAPVRSICTVVTSAQGGPEIYPELKLEEEFFVVRDELGNVVRESCSVLHKTPRTIIALKENNIHIFIITNENPMTLEETRELIIKHGMDKAMAFDGGSSTSLNYRDKISVVSAGIKENDTGRRLKSFMLYK